MRTLICTATAFALVLGFAATPTDAHPGFYVAKIDIAYKEKVKKAGSFKAKGTIEEGEGGAIAGDGNSIPGWNVNPLGGLELFEKNGEEPSIIVPSESDLELPLSGFDGSQLRSKIKCQGEDCGEGLDSIIRAIRPNFSFKGLSTSDLGEISFDVDSFKIRGSMKSKLRNNTSRVRASIKYRGTLTSGPNSGQSVKGVIKVKVSGDFGFETQ